MQDILLDENFEVKLKDGDIAIGISDTQQKELLLICNKGSFKENPAVCVGAWGYLEAEDPAALIAEVKTQFKGDGMEVRSVEVTNGKLLTEAYYL